MTFDTNRTARVVNWRGRSGAYYALSPIRLDSFALDASDLTIIARGPLVMWVGSADDIVHDADSRARFRLALDCADRVYQLAAPTDPVARMTLIWELEGAEPFTGLSAA